MSLITPRPTRRHLQFPATHPTVNGGNTHDYGYAYDSTTACLYGGGDRQATA